jgi:LysR family transcriptional regulator, hydrogen peroxide-inducible genes activator
MPTLRQFRYLVAVAETLSFRRAAEICHVTQPTLSDQIRELEARLKVQLIERTRRKVVMTPIGHDIADRAQRVLRDVQDIIDLADRGRHILEGKLRLGVLPSLGPYLLPLVLPYLRQRYPDLKLYLREDMANKLLQRLEDGDLDLLVFPVPVRQDGFSIAELFREPLWLALPKEHPLSSKDRLEPADLKGLTVLALETGHSLHGTVLSLCREYGANPLLDFATTSLDTLRQMAAMNVGATFLPALYVRAEAREDRQLAVIRFSEPEPSRNIGLVWREKSARSSEYLALATHIRDVLVAEVPEVFPLPPV